MNMTLGQFIKNTRKSKKITQSELAEMIGKKTITIRKYESNEISPNLEVLERISSALNTPLLDLIEKTLETELKKGRLNLDEYINDEDRDSLNEMLSTGVLSINNNLNNEINNLSVDELDLLNNYNSMNEEGQKKLIEYSNDLIKIYLNLNKK